MPWVGYLWFGFLVLVGGLGVWVTALAIAELEWWVDLVGFESLAAAASWGCSCSRMWVGGMFG